MYNQRISAIQLIPNDGIRIFPNKEAVIEPWNTNMTTITVLLHKKKRMTHEYIHISQLLNDKFRYLVWQSLSIHKILRDLQFQR